MFTNSIGVLLARIKIKIHGVDGCDSWGLLLALLGVIAAIWGLIFWVENRGKKRRREMARLGTDLARQKGCVDSSDCCWFCGTPVDGRAMLIPLNNRIAVIDQSWQVKKIPVFCCEKCQEDMDLVLLMGHPRIAPLLAGDFKIGTGK